MVAHPFHAGRKVVGIGPYAERGSESFIGSCIVDGSEYAPTPHTQICVIIKRPAFINIHSLKGGVGVLGIIQIGSEINFPITESRGVLYPEFGLLFH